MPKLTYRFGNGNRVQRATVQESPPGVVTGVRSLNGSDPEYRIRWADSDDPTWHCECELESAREGRWSETTEADEESS